jgi:cytochrome b subunit of formate dehydrogenase
VATTTERRAAQAADRIPRHPRRVRWFHTAVYLVTLPLIFTGWWLLLGAEGRPSPLARLTGLSDARLHVWLGRALLVLAILSLGFGVRGIGRFLRETFRVDRGDGRWWVKWPLGSFTGRFGRHEGHFDPGQRLANIVIVGGLLVLTATGIAMTILHHGQAFATLDKIHKVTTFIVTPFIVGHLLIAFSILPGYRGVWRSMHWGGRVSRDTARRVWPGWAERSRRAPDPAETDGDG